MAVSKANRTRVRLRTYKCKYCGERVERSKPYCPSCKTRKGTRGLGAPAGSGFIL